MSVTDVDVHTWYTVLRTGHVTHEPETSVKTNVCPTTSPCATAVVSAPPAASVAYDSGMPKAPNVNVFGTIAAVVDTPDHVPVGTHTLLANEKSVPTVKLVADGVEQTTKVCVDEGIALATVTPPGTEKVKVIPGRSPCAAPVLMVDDVGEPAARTDTGAPTLAA